MVKTRVARTESDSGAEGIHILNPTAIELLESEEEADIKGFSTVWIEGVTKE